MNGLLGFLQSASNTAANTVAGPVDLIAAGLRKVGVPVPEDPVAGANWMKHHGLLRDVPDGAAKVLGETAGMLTPALAMQYAPQIASVANKAISNAMAPTSANKELGAIVWHGSPHKFDAFDAGKIGTGEGSQAYGYGHYTAESPSVARSYAAMAGKPARRQARLMADGKNQVVLDSLITMNAKKYTDGDVGKLAELIKQRPGAFSNPEAMIARSAEYVDNMPPSYMYKIDLPDEQIAKMIDLEANVPESIRAPLSKKALDEFGSGISLGTGDSLLKEVERAFKSKGSSQPAKDAAEWLRSQGIPGLKFKDAGSRFASDGGTSNFVVFPGNESILSILERNSQALK